MFSTMQTLSFRLAPGQDLQDEIEKLVQLHRIEAGLILTCVGSLRRVSLRLANQPSASEFVDQFWEIVSLVGTISIHGSHLHASVANSKGETIGGHLTSGNAVYTTAEIVIGVLNDVKFTRERDQTYGYDELNVIPNAN